MCITPLEYTPVSRSQIFSLTGEYTTADICKGVKCETVRAQVRTSVQQRDDGSTLRWVPFRGSFTFQQQRLSILLFHQSAEGEAYVSKLFAQSIIRGLGQYFHTAEVPG